MQEIQDSRGSQGLVVIQTTTSVTRRRTRLRTFALLECVEGVRKPGSEGSNSPTGLGDRGRSSDMD
jgi:hypothetical protein